MKAVGLLSGGLDSTLAAKLMIEQGIEVHAVNFTSPFCTCTPKSAGCASVITAVEQLGNIPLRRIALGDDYLSMVKAPRHGYGSGMNPCIDCRALKIRRAGEYMREIGASFLFTGEVLGQRPMSQHRRALELIDKDSGMEGFILRPLSARYLAETVPEKEGWVDRSKLLSLAGRGRKPQIEMAKQFNIADYPCPAGGCLLTDKNFSLRFKEYLETTAVPRVHDIPLLKVGRHFRLPQGERVIVARDEAECNRLLQLRRDHHSALAPLNFNGPVVLVEGESIAYAMEYLLQYSKIPADLASPECEMLWRESRSVVGVGL